MAEDRLSGMASNTPFRPILGGGCTAAAMGSGSAKIANTLPESVLALDVFCKVANGNEGANGGANNSHNNRAAVQHNQAMVNNSNQPEKRLSILITGLKFADTFII